VTICGSGHIIWGRSSRQRLGRALYLVTDNISLTISKAGVRPHTLMVGSGWFWNQISRNLVVKGLSSHSITKIKQIERPSRAAILASPM
jgi:hypothetical protein